MWPLRFGLLQNVAVYSASSGGMPSGALGVWYFDQYQAVGSNGMGEVPNAALGSSVSNNLIPMPRRWFGISSYWQSSNLSLTDANANAPDGTVNAATTLLNGGTSWSLAPAYLQFGRVLPAGTYTLAISARWKGTAGASFRLGPTSALQTFTATDQNWHRYSMQFTANGSSGLSPILQSADSTGSSWEICDFEMFAGSSDLGPVGANGNIVIAPRNNSQAGLSVSGGGISFGANTNITAGFSLPGSTSVNAFSLCYIISKEGVGANASYQPFIADKNSSNFRGFAVGYALADYFSAYHSTNELRISNGADLILRTGQGFVSGCITFDGSTIKAYVNGYLIASAAGPDASTVSVQDMFVATLQNNYNVNMKFHAVALYSKALTATEVVNANTALRSHATSAGVTVNSLSKVVVFEGDSISIGTGDNIGESAGGFHNRLGVLTSASTSGVSYAVGGSVVSQMASRASAVDAKLADIIAAGKTAVLHVLIGANDLHGDAGELSTLTTGLGSYLDGRRSANPTAKIIVGTIIDRSDGSIVNQSQRTTNALSANSTIAGWVGTKIDAVSDFAANANFTPSSTGANANSTTYYNDKVHPSPTGHGVLASIAGPVIASF
jgi:lysophospholipase L1-like esterase